MKNINETVSRAHFRLVAKTLAAIPDEKKRGEMAQHHAKIFAKANPKFSFEKFFDAANVPVKHRGVEHSMTWRNEETLGETKIQTAVGKAFAGNKKAWANADKRRDALYATKEIKPMDAGAEAEFNTWVKRGGPVKGKKLGEGLDHEIEGFPVRSFYVAHPKIAGRKDLRFRVQWHDQTGKAHFGPTAKTGEEAVAAHKKNLPKDPHKAHFDAVWGKNEETNMEMNEDENMLADLVNTFRKGNEFVNVWQNALGDDNYDLEFRDQKTTTPNRVKNMRGSYDTLHAWLLGQGFVADYDVNQFGEETELEEDVELNEAGLEHQHRMAARQVIDKLGMKGTHSQRVAGMKQVLGKDYNKELAATHITRAYNRMMGPGGDPAKVNSAGYRIRGEEMELDEAKIGKVKKGAFHKWLGKKEGEPITGKDIEMGIASKNAHVREMANFARNAKKWHHEQAERNEEALARVLMESEGGIYTVEHNGKVCHTTMFKDSAVQVAKKVHENTGHKPTIYHRGVSGELGRSFLKPKMPVDYNTEEAMKLSDDEKKAIKQQIMEMAKKKMDPADFIAAKNRAAAKGPGGSPAVARAQAEQPKHVTHKQGMNIAHNLALKGMAQAARKKNITDATHDVLAGEFIAEVDELTEDLNESQVKKDFDMLSKLFKAPDTTGNTKIRSSRDSLGLKLHKKGITLSHYRGNKVAKSWEYDLKGKRKGHLGPYKGLPEETIASIKTIDELYSLRDKPVPNSEFDSNPGYVAGAYQVGGKTVKVVRMGNVFAPVKVVVDDDQDWKDADGNLLTFHGVNAARDAYQAHVQTALKDALAAAQSGLGGQYTKDEVHPADDTSPLNTPALAAAEESFDEDEYDVDLTEATAMDKLTPAQRTHIGAKQMKRRGLTKDQGPSSYFKLPYEKPEDREMADSIAKTIGARKRFRGSHKQHQDTPKSAAKAVSFYYK